LDDPAAVIALGRPTMMDDHLLLSNVRNELADALKELLKHQIMFREDFAGSREHVLKALRGLDDLLRQQDGY
jgi:hypothetical protein